MKQEDSTYTYKIELWFILLATWPVNMISFMPLIQNIIINFCLFPFFMITIGFSIMEITNIKGLKMNTVF